MLTSDEALLDAYVGATAALAPNDRPNAVVVVGEYTIVWASFDEGSSEPTIQPQPSLGTHVFLEHLGGSALLVFYMTLMKVLAAYPPPELDLISYVNKSGGVGLHEGVLQKMPEGARDDAPVETAAD